MGVLKALLFTTLLYLVAGANEGNIPPGPSGTNTTTQAPTTTSSTTASPPTPTSSPNTTTSSPTPSTTSTTPPSTTSTPAPKPTTTSTTTTTSAPPTPSTTTAKPTTPKPPTRTGRWAVNYTDTQRPCLIFQAEIDIDVTYEAGKVNKTVTVPVNASALAHGQCLSDETLTLSWGVPNALKFNFKKTNDSKYVINAIIVTLNVSVPEQKDGKQFVLAHNEDEFATPISNSYKCAKAKSLHLTSQMKNDGYFGVLRLTSLQLQAFRNSNSTKFDQALDCENNETSDVVPIAVGCALAALVVIVLIAYLIGRRRSQARGYLSM